MNKKSRKPLINWCRWHDASLRFAGHDARFVWGELAFADGHSERYRFDMLEWVLVRSAENGEITEQLDEVGIKINPHTA